MTTIRIDILKRPRARLCMVHYPSRSATIYHHGQPRVYRNVKWASLRRLCAVLAAGDNRWACIHRNDFALSYGYTEVITCGG